MVTDTSGFPSVSALATILIYGFVTTNIVLNWFAFWLNRRLSILSVGSRTSPIQVNSNHPEIVDTNSPTQDSTIPFGTCSICNDFDEIIPHPEDVHHRNLVLCFDGTGDQFDRNVSVLLAIHRICGMV